MNQQIYMLQKVAAVLADVPQTVVFTGGATISLYLDDVSAPDIRPTDDVDCVVEISSRTEYYQFSELLRSLGLEESTDPGAPLCRWRYEDITVDVMPCDESVLGFSNRWYTPGIANSIAYELPNGKVIQIFSVPYLLASKIEAFIGRGQRSFYFSADIEDIVALLDGCDRLEVEVQQADAEVRKFLSAWFRSEREGIWEVIPAFLSPAARNAGRGRLVRERIERLIHLA
ncbi:nucleotidyl transferase AbiEii/AbiGii toxin family protein [Planktothrix sp. FACHB-1355]|uniref:Nucleotidyl transferase AbiEii/AbiGii toxin family protein n=1 Tax=Aerosakkonema funiforme FACHB-1375 TaxID=2949571 RepID=A0A926VIK1_9CYAN|nr:MULTISPECIES: nucleotidyl transferase AbiEii/AbiGii toxin family protein [Oscillatoriales]MBD2184561.1 nucleotidyl transferase AbiEii/AbiGii toxin family protein [Aerosakkonema funiforme FACHB-1375]MBD3558860.1 nucleotidyl transferase AbiEii/AbiGii toxin family protein [Planktothrix sp. FACHB-1355]